MEGGRKYSQAFVREVTSTVKAKNGRSRKVHRAWKGVLKYSEPNPNYVEKPKGEDTRTASQRRREVWRQVAKTFDAETVKTKTDALEALQTWRARLEGEELAASLPTATTTVGAYVNSFVDDLEASHNIERSTAGEYRSTAKRIAEGFPDTTIRDLTPTMIQKWENGLVKSGLSPRTVTKYHRLLSEVCKHAVNVRELEWNPCAPVKTPKVGGHSPNSLTAEGFARLAATLAAMEPTPTVTAAAISLFTGMRQGEVCGLRWRDYNAEAATIAVRESIGRDNGAHYVKAPKTKSSIRTVPVSRQLAQALRERREAMRRELEAAGMVLGADDFGALYIVGNVEGRYLTPERLSRNWKSLSSAFGLTGTQGRAITFHDLRHTFATQAIANGADVKAVASYLGHASAAMTLNVYADADPESKRRVADLMARAASAQGDVRPYAVTVEGVPVKALPGGEA